jgi:hypothetical protein
VVAGSNPAGVASLSLEFLRVSTVLMRTKKDPCAPQKANKTGWPLHHHYTKAAPQTARGAFLSIGVVVAYIVAVFIVAWVR